MANWKRLERKFGETWAFFLGEDKPFRRNDAMYNAGDPERNSDVDVIHKGLEVPAVGVKGLVGECRYIGQGLLGYIHKGMKQATSEARKVSRRVTPVFMLNEAWVCHWLKDGMKLWNCLVVDNYPGYGTFGSFHIKHQKVGHKATLLHDKWTQVRRYATTKSLFPVLCFGFKGIPAIEVFNLGHIQGLRE